MIHIQSAAEKSEPAEPLNFYAVFSATVWNFNLKFYSFIYWNLRHLSTELNFTWQLDVEVFNT